MARVLLLLLFGLLGSQTICKAAPREDSDPVITTNIEDLTTDTEHQKFETTDDASQSQRQKRFYDYISIGYPPYDLPSTYPGSTQSHYSKRDESQNSDVYGAEDALSMVFNRLRDIVRDVRQQSGLRPPQTPIPAYIPFLYIPPYDCRCPNNNQTPAPPVNDPTPRPSVPPTPNTRPTNSDTVTSTDSNFSFEDRFGGDSTKDDASDDDGRRPINLRPIPPEEPFNVPVPPVDHGTVQVGAKPEQIPGVSLKPTTFRPPMQDFTTYLPPTADRKSTASSANEDTRPSLCDGAIISCCNQQRVTHKCFELLGCDDPFIYGKPCDPKTQLMVVNKFQVFQNRRAG